MIQYGLDYASIDGDAPPDFVKVRQAGAAFVIIRKSFALHGQPTADPFYARDAQRARDAGMVVGSYGFVSFAKTAPSAVAQIAHLVGDGTGVIPKKDLPYCIDVEFPGRGIGETGRTQREAFEFLLELISEVRRLTGGVSPVIYTSNGQWHDDNGLGGPDSSALDGCPLWVKTPYRLAARHVFDLTLPRQPHVGVEASDPHDYWRLPRPWRRQGWWLHQFQGDALGFPQFNMTVDVSHFHPLSASTLDDAPRIGWVQRQLSVVGAPYVGALNVTGVWDEATEQSLKAFQRAHQLPGTGIVDVATFASLCW